MTRFRIVPHDVRHQGIHYTVERRRIFLGLSWWSVVNDSFFAISDIEVRPIKFPSADDASAWVAEETRATGTTTCKGPSQ